MARLLTLSLFLISFNDILAQKGPAGVKVLYDPILWKQQLKLNSAQCNHIRIINSDYYQAIESLHEFRAGRDSLQQINKRLLVRRSEQLWSVLRPRQQHKWEKIHLSPATRRSSSKGLSSARDKRASS
ncbi:MAG TPA: hypothetical protein VEB86_14505 [Chryseosolibacter sp.]|nr:hypothetical protein [Chryseosolibacter sp.]